MFLLLQSALQPLVGFGLQKYCLLVINYSHDNDAKFKGVSNNFMWTNFASNYLVLILKNRHRQWLRWWWVICNLLTIVTSNKNNTLQEFHVMTTYTGVQHAGPWVISNFLVDNKIASSNYDINHTRFVEMVAGATDKKVQYSYFTLFRVGINWARIL